MGSICFETSYFKEVEKAKKERWPILIPIGTIEYHSTTCPYGTDALIAKGMIDEVAKRMDCVVMPTVWYGVSSYAVAGPEKNSIHVDCDTFEQYIYSILKSLLYAGFNRNIYLIIAHQTEDFNPMELACKKAARKLIFDYLDDTKGYGWWGKNENKEFYQSISAEDNPWNWIQVMTNRGLVPNTIEKWGCKNDHAGRSECSSMEFLYPNSIKIDRLKDTDDWFAQDAINMDVEMGKDRITEFAENFVKLAKKQKGID